MARIYRVERDRNYATINLYACDRDDRLSWKAVGLLVYLTSRPDGWVFRVKDLINRHSDGRDAVQSGLTELRDAGYLRRRRYHDSEGQLDWEWCISESPMEAESWDNILAGREQADGGGETSAPHHNGKSVNGDHHRKTRPYSSTPDGVQQQLLQQQEKVTEQPALDLGEEEAVTGPDPHARAVGAMCQRFARPWPLKSKTIGEWCREIRSDPKYAGINFEHETRKSADWWDGNGRPPKRIDMALRNWYERARKIMDEDAEGNGDEDEFMRSLREEGLLT